MAAIGIVLTQDWSYYFFRGTSEPMLDRLSLWAIDRLLDGQAEPAFVLASARPDPSRGLPFIALYVVWLLWREPRLRAAGARSAGLVPDRVVRATVDRFR